MNRRKSLSLAINALLCTLIIVFTAVPITIGPVRLAVLMLVPVLVAGQTGGLGTAVFSGTFLGIVSLITSFVAPTSPLSYAFQNPMISVFPRLFIGLVVYGVYHFFLKVISNEKIAVSVGGTLSAILGVMTNTGLVSLMLWAFYGKTGIQGTVVDGAFMQTVILANFLVEVVVCAIITPPISLAVRKTMDRAGGQ